MLQPTLVVRRTFELLMLLVSRLILVELLIGQQINLSAYRLVVVEHLIWKPIIQPNQMKLLFLLPFV
jgi:hypothetical protein